VKANGQRSGVLPEETEICGQWGELSNRWGAAAIAGLLLLVLVAYANALLGGFVYDDHSLVLNNPYVHTFGYLRQIFTTSMSSFAGVIPTSNYYRPLVSLSYLLAYKFFGPLAYGFHLVNVLIHAGCVCILFVLTLRIFSHRSLALLAAALFAVHPIHSEAVSWISGLPELEYSFFYLLAFLLFVEMGRAEGSNSRWNEVGAIGAFVAALLAKEQALTFPILATVYEHFFRQGNEGGTRLSKVRRYAPLWLVAAGYLLLRTQALGSIAPHPQRPHLGAGGVFLSGVALLGEYLWKLAWPVRLSAYYTFHEAKGWLEPRVLVGFAALLLCVVLFAVLWRRARSASFGIAWMLVTLLPVLNARWMSSSVFGERYLYLPSVGLCWILAWACVRIWHQDGKHREITRVFVVVTLATVLSLWSLRTMQRNREWRTDISLYTATLAEFPDALLIRNNLGMVFWTRGDNPAAEREWLRVLESDPGNPTDLTDLGMLYAREKRFGLAETYLLRALEAAPRFASAHLVLGEVYAQEGATTKAEEDFRAAIALSPVQVSAYNDLGMLLRTAGRFGEAEGMFRSSIETEPNAAGFEGLAQIALQRGEYDQAEKLFQRALSLDGSRSSARFGLGGIYASKGQTGAAMREYEAGLEIDPRNPQALLMLEKLKSEAAGAHPSKH
jgi:protein O-mannosyl-transferase